MGFSGGDIATALVVTGLMFAVDGLDFDCREREPGFYGDSKDCNKYYRCVGERAFAFSCGVGLQFNVAATACDWPETSGCEAEKDPDSDTGTDSDTSSDFHPSCYEKTDGSRFRDPDDCTIYYTCQSGRLFKERCYSGLQFNTKKGVCDYSQNVDCGVKLAINNDPSSCVSKASGYTYRDSESCSTYYVCVYGKAITKTCPSGTVYDVVLQTCNFINKVDCTKTQATTIAPKIIIRAPTTTTASPGQGDGAGDVDTTAALPEGGVDTTAALPEGDVDITVAPDADDTDTLPGAGVTTTTTTTTTTTRPTTRQPKPGEKLHCLRRVCYYTNWSQYRPGMMKFYPEDIDPFACTHVIFAFAKVVGGKMLNVEWNDMSGWQPGLYERVENLKKKNPELKTLLAIGGWNHPFQPFSDMVQSRESRRSFVDTTIPFLIENGFDGLDLDWEYPGNRGSLPVDKQRFSELVKDLRLGFDQFTTEMNRAPLLVTAAVAAGKATISTAYEISKISKDLDFINLMTYDLHGSWDKKTGHNAALNGPSSDTNTVMAAVDYWVSNGCQKNKLVVGLALYGHTFTLAGSDSSVGAPTSGPGLAGTFTRQAGFLAYYEMCKIKSEGGTEEWDAVGKVPYLVKGDQWVSFDNARSLQEKVRYIRTQGLGGVMCWALPLDDFKNACKEGVDPLWKAVRDECAK